MRHFWLLLGLLFPLFPVYGFSYFYVGKESNEARLGYSHRVQINSLMAPDGDEAYAAIIRQAEHLFGPMDFGPVKAVPRGNYRVRNIDIYRTGLRTFEVSFDISMTVAIEASVKDSYMVVLPINPDTIFEAAKGVNGKNQCTDPHYQEESDFWYFWSPDRPGCRLKEGRDYEVIEASVKPIFNSETTYAEFDRMADSKGIVLVDMFYGMDEPEQNSWGVGRSKDVNALNYRYVARKLRKLGFERRKLLASEIRKVALEIDSERLPTVEVFTKTYPPTPGRNIKKMVVTMFFGATGLDETSSAFHYFYKRSLENSAVMIYAGHSGLGGHLDVNAIEDAREFDIQFDKSRYQLFYFNSCTSYTYYNTHYFSHKRTRKDFRGTKNLDIITNGLSTYFSSIDESNLEVVRSVDTWAQGKEPPSFQEMMRNMDSGNLIGVNGDEDNPVEVPTVKQ